MHAPDASDFGTEAERRDALGFFGRLLEDYMNTEAVNSITKIEEENYRLKEINGRLVDAIEQECELIEAGVKVMEEAGLDSDQVAYEDKKLTEHLRAALAAAKE